MTERRQFESTGVMAIEPSALTIMWANVASPTMQRVGRSAVVPIQGPLASKPNGFFQSYPEIVSLVSEACASDAAQVVLHFDSPGGDVKGLFEACSEIQGLLARSGKKVVSFVEGNCCSAAYALALVAPEVCVTSTSVVGSVGTLGGIASHSRANREHGIDVVLVSSGARKADGHPDADIAPEAVSALQSTIDDLAAVFFDHCAALRPQMGASSWRALEAATFVGAKAVNQGLATHVSTYAQLVGVMMDKDQVKEALKALAEDGDEEAKKALAAMEGSDEETEEEAPASEAQEDEPSAEGDAPADDEEEKDKEPSASASVDVLKELVALKREVLAIKQTDERKALMAKRPDLTADPKYKAYLSQLSLKDLRQAVALTPKNPPANPAAAANVAVSQGKDQGKGGKPAPGEPDVAALMGRRAETPQVHSKDGVTVYSRMTASQARAALAAKGK